MAKELSVVVIVAAAAGVGVVVAAAADVLELAIDAPVQPAIVLEHVLPALEQQPAHALGQLPFAHALAAAPSSMDLVAANMAGSPSLFLIKTPEKER